LIQNINAGWGSVQPIFFQSTGVLFTDLFGSVKVIIFTMKLFSQCRQVWNFSTSVLRDIRQELDVVDIKRVLRFQLELRPSLQGVPYWVSAVVVGLIAVFYGSTYSRIIIVAQWVVAEHPYYLFALAPLSFFLAAWVVVRFAPAAGGTGVPAVNYALGLDPVTATAEVDRVLNPKVMLVVILSSWLCMLGGGALGREGPMVHIAACAFYFVGRQFKKIWPYEEHRSWIVAGGAAGVAAAFNAPLAGIVFVLEELSSAHFHRFKTVTFSAVIVAGMVSQFLSGRYLYFGYPRLLSITATAMGFAMLVGIICGILVFIFQSMIRVLNRRIAKTSEKQKLGLAVVVGVLIAAIAVFGNSGSIGGGISVIENLLFHDVHATWGLIVARFFATLLSHLSGCAGGFLAPGMALGAAVGSKMAVLLDFPNHNLLVLVGMAGFLSALLGAPFTAWVIVMEMTDQHAAIFPLMMTSLIASGMVRILTPVSRNPPPAPGAAVPAVSPVPPLPEV
jgi:H+/Cl- antiporter ClcA